MSNVYDETLEELREYANRKSNLRSRIREINITPLKDYSKEEIKQLRINSNFTQSMFALLLGVSTKAIEAWESGRNKPSGSTIRILQIIEQDPHALEQYNILTKA